MSGWWIVALWIVALLIVALLVVLFGLCARVRQLEQTRRDVPMRKPASNHFHSIGHGVTFPCDDQRCPEWRADR